MMRIMMTVRSARVSSESHDEDAATVVEATSDGSGSGVPFGVAAGCAGGTGGGRSQLRFFTSSAFVAQVDVYADPATVMPEAPVLSLHGSLNVRH